MLPPAAFLETRGARLGARQHLLGGWICVGHVSAVAEPGAFVVREIGGRSFVVIGGEDGVPHAFLNVCRHRGARLVEEAEGKVRRRIQCPYHAWSYDLEGNLRAAPHMDGVEDFDTSCYGLRRDPHRGARRPRPGRPLRRGRPARGPRRRAPPAPRPLQRRRPRPRRERRVRRRRQLEGDRRELQRVPALPRRPPGAERAQRLHERRRLLRRGRLVRRLDDPERGGRDDGQGGRPPRPPADRLARRGRPPQHPLLRALPQRADLAPSRLRDAAHPVAARAGPHRRRLRVLLRARDDGAPRLRPLRRDRLLGPDQPPGLARLRTRPEGGELAGYSPGRYSAEEADVHAFDAMVAARYAEGLREVVA